MQFLYSRGIRPDIICGTSIGAVNGLALAEGEGGLLKLVSIWQGFKDNSDMYVEEPWLKAVKPVTGELPRMRSSEIFSATAGRMVNYTLFPPMLLFDAVNFWTGMVEHMYSTGRYRGLKSFYNLSPLAAKLRSELDTGKVSRSGIRLRITMTGLESGELRYVTESGYFSGGDSDRQVDLVDAVIASASIPGLFPPVKLYAENYVDGGIREMLPVQAAVDLGATQVYAIACSERSVGTSRSFDDSTLTDIASRSMMDIALNEIQRNDAEPPRGWGGDFMLIQPTLNIHDTLAVDPGMISISMAYGYMRAFDVIEGSTDTKRCEDLSRTSDEITSLRLNIWKMEHLANGEPGLGERISIHGIRPMPDHLLRVRSLKRDLRILVDKRRQLGGTTAIPPGAEAWWEQWERHKWTPLIPAPWDRFVSPAGAVEKETQRL